MVLGSLGDDRAWFIEDGSPAVSESLATEKAW